MYAPTLCHKVEQVQRKAARFVHSSYTDRTPGCVTKMVQDLGWESLEHRRYISRLMMLFKIHHQIVEVSGATEALQLNDSRTRGSHRFKQSSGATTFYRATEALQLNDSRTRGSHRFKQSSGATPFYRDSFFHRTISDWNRLLTQVTDCTTIEAFQAILGTLTPCH